MKLASFLALALSAVSGCSTIYDDDTSTPLIPNVALNLSHSVVIPAENMVGGLLLYLIIDPLAPNWHIEQARLTDDRFRIALKKKRFTTGGDGEAAQVFYRRANLIALEHGSGRYRVIEFTEGIESAVPIAQRVVQGVIEVVH